MSFVKQFELMLIFSFNKYQKEQNVEKGPQNFFCFAESKRMLPQMENNFHSWPAYKKPTLFYIVQSQ